MILDRIIAQKKREVEALKRSMDDASLSRTARALPPARDFASALHGPGCAIIAEIKKRSPSAGVIRENFDHGAIALCYELNGAAAVSVLTDSRFFGGDDRFLGDVRDIISLPLLRKDFIIDEHQIVQSRLLGSDAVLLIAAILDTSTLGRFIACAGSYGMSALVEVHSEDELQKALSAGARLIGINNRDLRTFETDIAVSIKLAPSIPGEIAVVSESGIRTRSDIERLMAAGIRAFLVGESLMSAADPGAVLLEILGKDKHHA